ncbi:MAG: DEAD/DEAH box helicase [Verrucomicrobiota bacterium]
MSPDRATLNLLNSFPPSVRKEGEFLQKEGAVGTIFGDGRFVQAKVQSDQLYRVNLRLEAGRWVWEVEPELPPHSEIAVCAAMYERVARGEDLPESPNEIGEQDLGQLLEEKLDRPLHEREEAYVEKVEKRYRRYELDQEIFDKDLVRLSAKWEIASYDPLDLWPTAPADIIEFWNYVAYAFDKARVPFPPFMSAITDFEATKDRMAAWERKKDIDEWEGIRSAVNRQPKPPRSKRSVLRLMVTPDDVRVLLQQGEEAAAFVEVDQESQFTELDEGWDKGLVRFDAASEIIWASLSEYWREKGGTRVDLNSAEGARLLNRLCLEETTLRHLVSLDERPIEFDPRRLQWECTESQERPGFYGLQLSLDDGEPLYHSVRLLPGPETLYLADEVVLRGPRPWMWEHSGSTEVASFYEVPQEIIESEDGLEFLARVGADLPEALQARVREAELRLTIAAELTKELTRAESEHVMLRLLAEEPSGRRREVLRRDGWSVEHSEAPEGDAIARYQRDLLDEFPERLQPLNPTWDMPSDGFRVRVTKAFPEKFYDWAKALPEGIEIKADENLETLLADPISAKVKFEVINEDIDWFDLKIVLDVEGLDISKEKLRALVAARGGFVRLEDGGWVRLEIALDEEQKDMISRLGLDVYDLSEDTHRMHVLQLADTGVKDVFDPGTWSRICDRASTLKLNISPAVPGDLQASLRPYQVEGYHFLAYLATNRFGGILADDMGLGKTIQSLTWVLWLREQSKAATPALVVCPKSVLDVWAAEAGKFAPALRVRVLRATDDFKIEDVQEQNDLLVLNYAQLRGRSTELKKLRWLAVILDEGQQIKNPDSKAAKAARELNADNRLVLTGTPIENRLMDMWSLMSFAMPGVLGNRNYFKKRFDRRKDATAQERLSGRLRPFLLRRTKKEVAVDLPPRTEEEVYAKMEGVQEELYKQELKRIQEEILGVSDKKELKNNSFVILQGLMRLRQICCHPGLVDGAHLEEESAKLTALFYLLDQLKEEGHKVLVFSQFVSMLDIIRDRLEEEDRTFHYLTGQTKDRKSVIDGFQKSEDPSVFLLSLKAGGSGLNLTSASYVILYDPWWNPAVENQAIDRTHRIGQKNKVIAYRLLIRDTVEEKIRFLQAQKRELVQGVLGDEGFASSLEEQDLRFLFQYSPEDLEEEKPKKRGGRRRRVTLD